MTSSNEIKTIIYKIIKGSSLENEIISKGGSLYRNSRPTNSNKEDIVISVLANRNAQFQMAYVNVNIYVPDIRRDNDYIEDETRTKILQKKAIDLFKEIVHNDHKIEIESQETFKVQDLNEHLINNKLLITILNL